ncbi:MAG: hypothetical protein EOM67_01995 [Spirochaetia bacterium]|nr:hypothetical protein [Spirochaetia bacterium]
MNFYYVVFSPIEAFIASQLEPKEFGSYMARGSKKGSAERLMFAEVKGEFGDYFDWDYAKEKCIAHSDGRPKHSLYLSIYRVIEHIPLEQYKDVYLVNKDGSTLSLKAAPYKKPANWRGYGLYKEHCPVYPFIVSSLEPKMLADYIINDTTKKITVPAIIFNDMRIIDFDEKEKTGNIGSMYDRDLDHLKDCIATIQNQKNKMTKTVDRSFGTKFSYQIIDNGIYIARGKGILFYPMHTQEALKEIDYDWGKSANFF